jgi:hypothetical protein
MLDLVWDCSVWFPKSFGRSTWTLERVFSTSYTSDLVQLRTHSQCVRWLSILESVIGWKGIPILFHWTSGFSYLWRKLIFGSMLQNRFHNHNNWKIIRKRNPRLRESFLILKGSFQLSHCRCQDYDYWATKNKRNQNECGNKTKK